MDDALVDPKPISIDEFDVKTYRALYHDSKLTKRSPWTDNQSSEIINKFKNKHPDVKSDHIGEYLEFEVRSSQEFLNGSGHKILETGDKIRIYKKGIYKSISSGDGETIIKTEQIFK